MFANGRRNFQGKKTRHHAPLGLVFTIALLAIAPPLFAQNKSYCVSLDDSKVPALVNSMLLTLNVNVGTCSSVSVTVNGVAVAATYTASTQTASFDTTCTSSIVVTAVSWTTGGTGAATKATLYANHKWAYSQTFDDVRQSQYDYAKPILDGLGLKAGLAAVASWLNSGNNYYMTWTEVQTLRAEDWDVYNHTWDHPDPVTCGTWSTEFGQDQTAFQTKLPGYNVTHAVMPYEVTIATCSGYPPNYLLSGELDTGGVYTYVDQPLSSSLGVARNGLYSTDPTSMENIAAQTAAAGASRAAWTICITHSVTQGSGAQADAYSTNQNALTTLYNYMLGKWGPSGDNSMWFAPAGHVQDYLFTRDNAVVSVCTMPSQSPTATGSPTAAATPSVSVTGTVSRTPSPSASPTSSPSGTSSATLSVSPSPSRTASASGTPSATLTPSGTSVPSVSETSSATASMTATGTPSLGSSATETASPTASPRDSATPSGTVSASASVTPSPAASAAVSATATVSGSATASPAASASATEVWTLSPTATPTATPSGEASATPSDSPSATFSAVPSGAPSGTDTATPTRTFTRTATPTATATASPTETSVLKAPSPTRSATRVLGAWFGKTETGPLVLMGGAPIPNPNPTALALDLAGPADGIDYAVFTSALILARNGRISQDLSTGWNEVPLGNALGSLARGIYYVQLRATRGNASSAPLVLKVYWTHP